MVQLCLRSIYSRMGRVNSVGLGNGEKVKAFCQGVWSPSPCSFHPHHCQPRHDVNFINMFITSPIVHGAAIYGNMDPINIPPMLAYIPYMDPMGHDITRLITWFYWQRNKRFGFGKYRCLIYPNSSLNFVTYIDSWTVAVGRSRKP